MPDNFADIAFPTAVRDVFTYHIPESLSDRIKTGMRVWVPLQSHKAIGMVVRIHDRKPDFKTRQVLRILDEVPVIGQEMLALTEWIHRFYYASWGEVIQASLPVGLNFVSEKIVRPVRDWNDKANGKDLEFIRSIAEKGEWKLKDVEKRWQNAGIKTVNRLVKKGILELWEEPRIQITPKMERIWKWSVAHPEQAIEKVMHAYPQTKYPKWVNGLLQLKKIGLPARNEAIDKEPLLTNYTLNRIRREGLIDTGEVPARPQEPGFEYNPGKLKRLNESQQKIFEDIARKIDEHSFQNFLLHGVTGSGKTEVYIHALKKVIDMGRGGIILVPEIALTPQTLQRFFEIFGNRIAILHSRLNDRERYEAWKQLQSGEKRIVIGTRSAVFAPVKDLGLIVLDEEHDTSYKQEDPAPRYHAREVAIMRAFQNDAVIVLGSATPSMVSLRAAQTGKSRLLELPGRHARAELPSVKIIDLKQYSGAMRGPLSAPLYLDMEQALERNEQVILLYNRRGFATYFQCESCGQIVECPNCSVSLTYHKLEDHLRCHYCGYSSRVPSRCPVCGENTLKAKGSGTQRVAEEITSLFPSARILRMDQDTTRSKNAHARILNQFGRHEADILVGTQVVAKGLDFSEVTVVGVINSDTELAFPSYRSGERMFQLLSQVAGRSGRSHKPGYVYLQTWKPDHFAIECASRHDYGAFALEELKNREKWGYPPYSRLIRIIFKGRQRSRTSRIAEVFAECLSEAAHHASVLGPGPSSVERRQQHYHWECLLRIDPSNGAMAIEKLLDTTFRLYDKRKPEGSSGVRINVNVDAIE